MDKILVVPDVHGRDFWKPVKNFKGRIIFLGDYHDPYFFEFDPEGEHYDFFDGELVHYYVKDQNFKEQSVQNFKEIVEFAKENEDRVTLLYGNHDWHYIVNGINASRKDINNLKEVKKLFESCKFQRFCSIGNTLFTHAGLSKEWADWINKGTSYTDALSKASKMEMFSASSFRGGEDRYSSPLWLDYHELQFKDVNLYTDDVIKFQVFSHTMLAQQGKVMLVENGACIDSRVIFEIDPENPKETLKAWNNA